MYASSVQVIIALAALLVVAAADHKPAPSYHKPAPSYHQPQYKEPEYGPPKYAYEYGVHDDYQKVDFGQKEERDGYSTYGSYRVALPDGRIQTVTYHVDDAYSGYVADVKYEGTPHYAEPHKQSYKPAPKYHKPAPKYHN